MAYILFEDTKHFDLLPFTFTRPVFDLRSGIYTFRERWEKVLGTQINTLAYDYLGPVFNSVLAPEEAIWINGRLVPDTDLLQLIRDPEPDSYYTDKKGDVLVARFSPLLLPNLHDGLISAALLESLSLKKIMVSMQPVEVSTPPDLFRLSGKLIEYDFHLVTRDQTSEKITDPHTRIYGADNIFVSPGVKIRAAIINAENGPVYIGRGVDIQEGVTIRKNHAIGDYSILNMGAKLRGDTSLGPKSKVGGEVSNSVIMGYSSKGHEGYLGNSVMGYWCNLGADTNTSNLKNNYSHVKLWHYPSERFVSTGLQFCGLMMGDHSKTGINTMFNTGTVVGVFANIFGSGFPRTYIPSFSWGGAAGFTTYRPDKAFEVAKVVMKRRGVEWGETDRSMLTEIYERTRGFRHWEKQNELRT